MRYVDPFGLQGEGGGSSGGGSGGDQQPGPGSSVGGYYVNWHLVGEKWNDFWHGVGHGWDNMWSGVCILCSGPSGPPPIDNSATRSPSLWQRYQSWADSLGKDAYLASKALPGRVPDNPALDITGQIVSATPATAGGLWLGMASGANGAVGAAAEGVGALSAADSWGNAATLARHFAEHGVDVGAASAEGYAEEASAFLQRAELEGLPTKIDSSGVIRVYDPSTNTFGAFNANGTTRTLFSPSRGAAYWADQPGAAPWIPGGGQ